MGGAELDRDSFVVYSHNLTIMPLTIDDVPDSFYGLYVRKHKNATEEEIVKAYEEQQGKQASNTRYWEDRGATGRRV